jgi:hypothetical protein
LTAAGGLASFHGGYLAGADGEHHRHGRRLLVLSMEPEFEIAARDFGPDTLDRLPVDDDHDCPVLDDRSHGVHVRGAGSDEVIRRGFPNRGKRAVGPLVEPRLAAGKNVH